MMSDYKIFGYHALSLNRLTSIFPPAPAISSKGNIAIMLQKRPICRAREMKPTTGMSITLTASLVKSLWAIKSAKGGEMW